MNPEASIMVRVADALSACSVPYLLVGSFSRAVMGVQGDKLDWPYIEGWCERHGTRALLEQIRKTVPRI